MNFISKTVRVNSTTIFELHPLAQQLVKLIAKAYIIGDQADFLISIMSKFNSNRILPIHNISMISKGSGANAYKIVGGCFNPLFDINNLSNTNSIFHSYSPSKNNTVSDFDKDIIDFIYLDFIRSISLLSLSKPGAMYPELRQLTQEYESNVWSEVFGNENQSAKNTFLLKHCAELLDKKRDTLIKQAKLLNP